MPTYEKRLRQLRKREPLAAALFDHVREHKPHDAAVPVQELARKLATTGRELRGLLRRLEPLHVGRLWVGRRGQVTRFEWAEGYPQALPGPAETGLDEEALFALGQDLPHQSGPAHRMLEIPVALKGKRSARIVFPEGSTREDFGKIRLALDLAGITLPLMR